MVLVLQDAVLFSGSVRDNLTLGHPGADDGQREVRARVMAKNCHGRPWDADDEDNRGNGVAASNHREDADPRRDRARKDWHSRDAVTHAIRKPHRRPDGPDPTRLRLSVARDVDRDAEHHTERG